MDRGVLRLHTSPFDLQRRLPLAAEGRLNFIWLICLIDTGEPIGDCGIHIDLRHRRGVLRSDVIKDGAPRDVVRWGLVREDGHELPL